MQKQRQTTPIGTNDQLGFDLAVRRTDYRREDFIVTQANRAACRLAFNFPDSDETGLAVTGPPGSGKTHLLHLLADERGGALVDAETLSARRESETPLLLIDNATSAAPKTLLAAFERARACGCKIVMAGRGAPEQWARGLRDLETRLGAMSRVYLDEPDEELLRAVISQRFRERQWRAAGRIADYAAPRIPRTFAAAGAFVEAVGAAAIAARRPITPAIARKVIQDLFEDGFAP